MRCSECGGEDWDFTCATCSTKEKAKEKDDMYCPVCHHYQVVVNDVTFYQGEKVPSKLVCNHCGMIYSHTNFGKLLEKFM